MDCGWACGESGSSHLWALYRRTWSYEDSAKIGRWENPNPNSILIANGRKAKNKISARSEYSWGTSSFEHILENRQLRVVPWISKVLLSATRVHKKVINPEDEWQIIPNTQEAIIDEDTFKRVQELRESSSEILLRAERACFRDFYTVPIANLSFISARQRV